MQLYEFGQRIKKRREELRMSQQELAGHLGIEQAKISLIERGSRKVDVARELPLLAKALRCTVAWLCEGDKAEDAVVSDPVEALIRLYLPDVHFEEFEKRKLARFLEGFLQTYASTLEPKKASNQ